jgi:glycosyltransferase involved in cell wall biosynthesis
MTLNRMAKLLARAHIGGARARGEASVRCDGAKFTGRELATTVAKGSASRSPRVLLIGPFPAPLGGVSVHVARLATALAGRGYAVRMLDEAPIIKAHVPNVRTISLRGYVSLLLDVDIVHTHSSNATVKLVHTVFARLMRRRVVTTIHSSRTDVLGRAMYRLACRLSHGVIPVSEQVRDALGIKGYVIPAFVPPSVEEEVVPQELAAWIAERRRERRLIVVSNASNLRSAGGEDIYGLDLLVEAFARPEVNHSHALLFVVATLRFGAERFAAMKKQIEERGLTPVVFLVHLEAPFAGIIKVADLVVRASSTDGDSLTVREALWYGKRVLASDCVKRPDGTELFRSRDVEDLVSKVVHTAPDIPRRELRQDFAADLEQVYQRAAKWQRGLMPDGSDTQSPRPQQHAKRILVISQYYEPDITAPAFRISETVELLRKDADVRVITAVPHRARADTADRADAAGVVRVPIRSYRGGGAIEYILHYLSFVAHAVWAGIKLRRSGWRADVIWVSSPPLFVGIAGVVLRHIMRCPLVLDIRDIWPESAVGVKMIAADGLLFRAGKILESWLYARADRMTCVSRAMKDYLAAASGKTVHVVYNGIRADRPHRAALSPIRRRILYAGNLGRAQGLDVLITAFAEARRRSSEMAGWTVEFVGAGILEDELRTRVGELNLGEVIRFHGVLGKPAAIAEMRESAALFINLLDEAVFALTVPSKVFDYMLAERPILYGIDNPEAKAILAESGANIEFGTNDVSSLVVAMVDLTCRLSQLETRAPDNSKIVLSRYTREEATRELRVALAAAEALPRPTLAAKLHLAAEGIHRRLERQFVFARSVPVDRMVRRCILTLKRRWLERFHPTELPVPAGIGAAAALPVPLMNPRGGVEISEDSTIRLTLLGKARTLTLPATWSDPGHERAAQLWWMTLNYMQYLEGTDDAIFVSLVDSWIKSVQPYRNGFWRDSFNSYTVSIRTVVWMQQLARRTYLPTELRNRMIRSILGQLHFLEKNLETDIGGNHLVKNIKALILGSVFFNGPVANRWRDRGLNLLAGELSRQILGDGMHYERSPSYHNQVFVDLLEIRYALGDDLLGGQLDRNLAAMAQVVADLAHGDGRPAQFNDSGLSMSYSSAECLEAFERVFGSKPSRRSAFSYPEAGYFGCEWNETLFIADCGIIGPDDLPAHSHGDILSFEWSVEGKRLIVDQGVYEYVAGARRAESRAASSHNTLSITGMDQADFFADFRVGRRPRPKVLRCNTTADSFYLEGCHDGYAPFLHCRAFEVSRKQLKIIDRVEGSIAGGVVVGLLLHPHAAATASGEGIGVRLGSIKVSLHATVPLEIEPAVWWPDLGVDLPTQRILARWPAGCVAASLTLSIE